MKKILVTLLVLGSTQLITAGNNTGYTKIKKMYTYDIGAVVITDNTSGNEDGCSYSNASSYFVIRFDTNGGKERYSAALSAFISKQNVRLGYSGCNDIWGASKTLPNVYRVDLSS